MGLFCLSGCNDQFPRNPQPLRIAAAASVAPVLETLSHHPDAPVPFVVDAGASGTLTRQIQLGASADVFISADPRWIDALIAANHAIAQSRRTLATNRLVIVTPPHTHTPHVPSAHATPPSPWLTLERITDPQFHPLAIGETQSVPVGHYAKQAFQHADLWPQIQPIAIMAPNARTAAAYVARRQCPAGVVYASDAKSSPNLHIVWPIDPTWHDPITITAVAIIPSPPPPSPTSPTNLIPPPTVQRLIHWLANSPTAQTEFSRAGFDVTLQSP